MRIDIERLLQDYNITYSLGGEKVSAGWIGIHCPFCTGSQNFHLGHNLTRGGPWHCWRCGGHAEEEVLEKITGLPIHRQETMLKYYRRSLPAAQETLGAARKSATSPTVPGGPLGERHWAYLESRRFDPVFLEQVYNLQGTSHTGKYKFRLVAPIHTPDGRTVVSYQTRDITGRAKAKYLPCRKEEEIIRHKHCLYARHLVPGNTAVIVEGITDAWRLGPGAVATFGIQWTPRQLLALRGLERCFILYDPEPQAQQQAIMLARAVSLLGLGAHVLTTNKQGGVDPGDMGAEEARELMRELYIH